MKAGAPVISLLLALLSAAVAPLTIAGAHEETAVHETAETAVIAALRANGARILALGERGGLDGHFVELADGDAYGLYVTPDGHAVAGLLYGPDGTLLTGRQIAAAGGRDAGVEASAARTVADDGWNDEAAASEGSRWGAGRLAHAYDEGPAVPGTGIAEIEMLFERSIAAFGFTLGRSGLPPVAVFADPGCRWSRSAVARLGGAALEGRLRLRVVPVGVLGAVSAREAASIASAPDPGAGLVRGKRCTGRGGGRAADRAQQRPLRRMGLTHRAADRLACAGRAYPPPSRRHRRCRRLAGGAAP